MNLFQSCSDASDAVELSRPQGLYLKPVAKLNISVQVPVTKLPGKTISNWEVMEKLKHMIKPEEFAVLKVSKSTIEFIRFEGEIENKSMLNDVLKKLDMRTLKLSGFPELLKVRAAESKIEFPSRHTWDAYFRDAKHMNEMKPGERPDTLHISNLPCKWFLAKHRKGRNVPVSDKPDEYIFRKVFEKFGEIRYVDVPLCDPYRNMMKAHISGIKMFSFGQDHLFEGYIQYQEYMGFVKAMDALRGMKLLIKEGDKTFTAGIKVEFDTSKHLSDASIRRRKIERDKLMALERERDDKERAKEELREKQEEEERLAIEEAIKNKSERRKLREEKRKKKQLKKLHAKEAELMNKKIATEERKLLLAQRQLESIRLLDYLFERVKEKKQKEVVKKKEEAIGKKLSKLMKKKAKKEKRKELKAKLKKDKLESKEKKLRTKLVKRFETVQEKEMEEQRERLRKTIEGKNKMKSVLAATCAQVTKSEAPSSQKGAELIPQLPPIAQATMNPQFQGVPGFSGNFHPGGPQWYPPPNNAYGYFENMPGQFQPPYFDYNFPNPGFQPRGGYFPRRGRGFWGPRRPRGFRRGGWNQANYYNEMTNQEYYKYFKKLAGGGGGHSRSHSRSRSKSRSRSRRRSRTRSRSHSRRRSRSRSRSHSRRSTHSKSRSRSRRRSRSRSVSRKKSRSRSRSRSRKRSYSGSRSRKRTRSRSRSRSRLRNSRSKSRTRKSRSKSRSGKRTHSGSSVGKKSPRSRSGSKPLLDKRRSPPRSKSPNAERPRAAKQRRTRSRSDSQSRNGRPVVDVPAAAAPPSGSESRPEGRSATEGKHRSRSHSRSWSCHETRSPRSRSWSQRQSRSPSLSKISSGTLSNDNTPKASENGVVKY